MKISRMQGVWLAVSAFFLSGVAMLAAYIAFGVYPFGEMTICVADMNNQYMHFHATLRELLLGGHGVFYSFVTAMGDNFLPLYTYYLASPLSLLVALFPAHAIPEALMVITLIKVALCGAAYALFARHVLGERDRTAVLFAPCYALCSYVASYASNIMWLDALALLPIVLLLTYRLLKTGKWVALCVALAALFYTQFYIAYMVGIFTFLCFAGALWVLRVERPFLRFLQFSLATGIAAGLCACTLVPTALRLFSTSAELANITVKVLNPGAPLEGLISRLFFGVIDSIKGAGAAPLYAGTISLILMIAYFTNKHIPGRERIAMGVITLFLFVSTMVPELTYFWQAFDFAAWFQYRFTFLLCFLFVAMAHRCLMHIDGVRAWVLPLPLVAGAVFLLFVHPIEYASTQRFVPTAILVLLAVWTLLLLTYRLRPTWRGALSWVMILLVCGEMAGNMVLTMRGIDFDEPYRRHAELSESLGNRRALLAQLPDTADAPYRVGDNTTMHPNDQLSLGYMGIQLFSSTSSSPLCAYLSRFGLLSRGVSSHYLGTNIALDSLWGIRYTLSHAPLNAYYYPLDEQHGMVLAENQYVLPMAFTAPSSMLGYRSEPLKTAQRNEVFAVLRDDFFQMENGLYRALFGEQIGELFTPVIREEVAYQAVTAKPADHGSTSLSWDGSEQTSTVHYTIRTAQAGPLYIYFTGMPQVGDAHVEYDGQTIVELPKYDLSCAVYVGDFDADETVELDLVLDGEQIMLDSDYMYSLNMDALADASDIAYAGELRDVRWHATGITGTVEAGPDQVLYLSIPYDTGWRATVDGAPVAVSRALDVFTAVAVPEGTHQVSLRYTPPGFVPGAIVSAVSLAALVALALVGRRQHKGANA